MNHYFSSKQKGNIGLSHAILLFTINGYNISLPLTESTKYDLIVDINNKLYKIQCKYTSQLCKKNVCDLFQSPLYVSGGNRSSGNTKKLYNNDDFDFIFISCSNNTNYLIPFSCVKNKKTINIGRESKWSKYEKYKIDIHNTNPDIILKMVGRVGFEPTNPEGNDFTDHLL